MGCSTEFLYLVLEQSSYNCKESNKETANNTNAKENVVKKCHQILAKNNPMLIQARAIMAY